ncbi:GNAT family N-acetyltransferase [Microbacterium paludicola]|uniref:GNAT family N-acetyltransferase n=1 Tax=Microbacterium paludicola TaxID=300019 RepID=UPI0011A79EBA|nr:GNAT family N-acetyltransferase [Microbacterium paludicola]
MAISLIDSVTLHPLELPARADAAPDEILRRYADVRNRSISDVTGRHEDDVTAESLLPMLRSNPEVARRQWYITDSDDMVGVATLNILADAQGRTAIAIISLCKAVWGRGIGSAVAAHIERTARDVGVRRLLAWVEHPASTADRVPSPTGFGEIPRDHHARFLLRHGFTLEQVERVSELRWSEDSVQRVRRAHADARRRAEGYRVVQWMLPTPAEHVAGYAWMKEHMSTDVPDAALGMPAEKWDADRIARHDDRYRARGQTVLVTAAEHTATGELCAYNELAIDTTGGVITHQEDTLVLSAHRGHRLGMLVKTAGLLTWREEHPHSPAVITYNAEENRPMLDINEAIGFAPISYVGAWKKDLT